MALIAAIAHERAVFFASVIDAIDARMPSELLTELGHQIVAYAGSTGPYYREFVAELTRHNATHDMVRTGVLAQALRHFADRVLDQGGVRTAADSAAIADLLAGAIIVSIANFANDTEFDLEVELHAIGIAIDKTMHPLVNGLKP